MSISEQLCNWCLDFFWVWISGLSLWIFLGFLDAPNFPLAANASETVRVLVTLEFGDEPNVKEEVGRGCHEFCPQLWASASTYGYELNPTLDSIRDKGCRRTCATCWPKWRGYIQKSSNKRRVVKMQIVNTVLLAFPSLSERHDKTDWTTELIG